LAVVAPGTWGTVGLRLSTADDYRDQAAVNSRRVSNHLYDK